MSANFRLLLIITAVILIGGAAWRLVELITAGRVTKATETYNQESRDAADQISDARARVRACHARDGMRWDRETGQCVRAVPGAGQ